MGESRQMDGWKSRLVKRSRSLLIFQLRVRRLASYFSLLPSFFFCHFLAVIRRDNLQKPATSIEVTSNSGDVAALRLAPRNGLAAAVAAAAVAAAAAAAATVVPRASETSSLTSFCYFRASRSSNGWMAFHVLCRYLHTLSTAPSPSLLSSKRFAGRP